MFKFHSRSQYPAGKRSFGESVSVALCTHTDTSSALALSGPARSEVQEELLAHVSGGLVNRVVISPPLFGLSPAFSSKSHGLPGGAGVTAFDWSER